MSQTHQRSFADPVIAAKAAINAAKRVRDAGGTPEAQAAAAAAAMTDAGGLPRDAAKAAMAVARPTAGREANAVIAGATAAGAAVAALGGYKSITLIVIQTRNLAIIETPTPNLIIFSFFCNPIFTGSPNANGNSSPDPYPNPCPYPYPPLTDFCSARERV